VCGKPTHDKTHTHDWLLLLSCYFFSEREDGLYKKEYKEGRSIVVVVVVAS
jgi:hypothetical protein